jgi:hypothetical protein
MRSFPQGCKACGLLVLLALAAACGGESAFQARKDASADARDDGARDMPSASSDGETDGTSADVADGEHADAGAIDAANEDAGIDVGTDAGIDAGRGDALPQFLRVWTFDQAGTVTDGWNRAFGLTGATIMYDATVGSPNPGSLLLNVPFMTMSGGEQFAIQASTAADLTHRQVTALIRLDSAGPALGRVGYSSTGSYVLVMAPPVLLTQGQWTTVTLDVDNPPGGSYIDTSHTDGDGGIVPPTPSDTRIITVVVSTPFSTYPYTTATFHVDLVGYY